MPLSPYALEKFVSQGISKLNNLSITNLKKEFPERESWYGNFVLNLMFHSHIEPGREGFAYLTIRRAQAALNSWETICHLASVINPQNISAYFDALESVEHLIAAMWQGIDFARKSLQIDVFSQHDGSEYERLNGIYNFSRHFDPESLPEGYLHAIWLTEDGVSCIGEKGTEWHIKYNELREILLMLGRVASAIANNKKPESEAAKVRPG